MDYVAKPLEKNAGNDGHQQMTTLHIYSWQQEVFSSIGDRTLLENTTADNLKHILDATLENVTIHAYFSLPEMLTVSADF